MRLGSHYFVSIQVMRKVSEAAFSFVVTTRTHRVSPYSQHNLIARYQFTQTFFLKKTMEEDRNYDRFDYSPDDLDMMYGGPDSHHLHSPEPLLQEEEEHYPQPHQGPPPFVDTEDDVPGALRGSKQSDPYVPFAPPTSPFALPPQPVMPPFDHNEDFQIALRGSSNHFNTSNNAHEQLLLGSNDMAEVVNSFLIIPLPIVLFLGVLLVGFKMEEKRNAEHRRMTARRHRGRQHHHDSDNEDEEWAKSDPLLREDDPRQKEWSWLADR